MSTFICEKCGCIDNTACDGNYWIRKDKNEPILCSECYNGKWHTHFQKRYWNDIGNKEEILKKSNKDNGTLINAEKYFKNQRGIK